MKVALTLIAACSALASAQPLAVVNPDFETPVDLPNSSTVGPFNFDDIPGWSSADALTSGIYRPNVPPASGSVLPMPPAFGVQTLFIGPNSTVVFQTLDEQIEAGAVYTLRARVGDRVDLPLGGGDGGSIGFFTAGGQQLVTNAFGGAFISSGWRLLSVAYTVNPAFAGQRLQVRVAGLGQQANFDNVEVLKSTVPPCSVADVALPFGVIDLADIDAFIAAFNGGDPLADIAAPFGVIDLSDIDAFIASFIAGCP